MKMIVYLDSCDFSDLSEADSKLSEENRQALNAIRSGIHSGKAQFVLSGVHLSEAVHATDSPSHKKAAVRRAALMTELCSDNFLRLPQEIMSLEIAKAMNGASDAKLSKNELFSGKSQWFGISLPMDFSQKRHNAMARLEEHIAHFPRNERRKLKSEWALSKASGREKWLKLANGATQPLSQEFPFNLFSAKFVTEWAVGHVSDEEYSKRLYEILNNPLGLVQSVLDLTEERQTIYDLLRKEGQKMQLRLDNILQSAIDKLSPFVTLHRDFDYSTNFRKNLPKEEMCRTIISVYGNIDTEHYSSDEITRIVAACPAVSVFLNMYAAYYCSRFESTLQRMRNGSATPRSRGASDFGDMMHAVYAPYCDLFRCDAYFASLLKQDPNVRARVTDRRGLISLSSLAIA